MARRPVARGGMFSTPKVTFSKDTEQLLKAMMKESHLTNFQQRKLAEKLKRGHSLPTSCPPTWTDTSPHKMSHVPQQRRRRSGPSRSGSGLRSKDTIDEIQQSCDEPEYRPPHSRYNSSVEKERLGNIMAYGTEVEEKDQSSKEKRRAQRHQEEEEVDRFEEVLQEIEERKEFLEEMEALGKGEEYRARIMTEISQRVRELETMDRQRSTQLGIKESLKNT